MAANKIGAVWPVDTAVQPADRATGKNSHLSFHTDRISPLHQRSAPDSGVEPVCAHSGVRLAKTPI
jgi:hypothetical protein